MNVSHSKNADAIMVYLHVARLSSYSVTCARVRGQGVEEMSKYVWNVIQTHS